MKSPKHFYYILVVLLLLILVAVVQISTHYSPDNSTTDLIVALEQSNYEDAEQAIRHGADVNYKIMGRPLLHNYIKDGDLFVVRFLIDHGADLSLRSAYGRSSLHEAALYARYDIALLLIKSGADVNARNKRGETPLFYAEGGLIAGPPHTPMHDKVAKLLRIHGGTR